MKRNDIFLIICCTFALLGQVGCGLGSVRLGPTPKKASKAELLDFYEQHRIALRLKSGRVRLGDGTRIRLLTDLKVLVPPKSETAQALVDFERFSRYLLITLGVGTVASLAGMGVATLGIIGPIPNRSREAVALAGGLLAGTAVLGTIGAILGLVIVANGKRINERILRHYNDDLRAKLKLPPRSKNERWRLPPLE